MADHDHKIASPPALAERLLALAVTKHDRSIMLGDLHEEFVERNKSSSMRARSWYWRQVLLSTPHLMRQRMQQNTAFAVAAILGITVFSFVLITLWDVYVARTTAGFLAQQIVQPPLLMIRLIYFLLQLTGTAVVGGLIARSLFSSDYTFRKNALTRLGPTALLLVAAAVVTWLSAGGNYPASYLVLRVGLAIPALVLGALVASRKVLH